MAVSDFIGIREYFLTYGCIPTRIKRELVKFDMNINQNGYVVRTFFQD